ncbi:hypothetical protein BpHYR1_031462 [Brachionus plicatilis]|uniref:Uncharacterized protein n=1 Tax=Brachionus plicatilis TaxID=10195 RepID=A0A3M7PJ27_BRAPC|nr:hypothetical protein BpHYR1_031462 [Brachionus plicatilis]
MFEKNNDLNARLENVSLNNVKRNALAIEKVSYETPKPSNEAVQSQSIQVSVGEKEILDNIKLKVFELIIVY